MKALVNKQNFHLILLFLILLLALFFRTYDIVNRFEFAHDGDLYSWIVKDIVVDKHLRLIGQLTTAPGIFIGPAFYYMLIPFFLLTKMDPVGAVIPVTAIGVLTVASYYYVFAKLFDRRVGLIAAFLYAVLLSPVYFDRRIVPSTPTNLWLIWYFYTVVMFTRGRYHVLPLLGLLIGLIWHIHIALIPALVASLIAIFLSRKLPSPKQVILAFFALLISSVPLLLFETRHGFSQTLSFFSNLTINHGGGVGLQKFYLVIIKATGDITRLLFYPQGLPFINNTLFVGMLLLGAIFLVRKYLLAARELVVFYVWIGAIILYYTFSSTIISEYYFVNIEIVFLTIVTLLLYLLYCSSRIGRRITIGVLAVILLKNAFYLITADVYHKGYNERKAIASYIAEDSRKNDFPCVGISYITAEGENVGFRYFFWLNNLHINHPQSNVPIYTIVLPDELAPDTIEARFGHIGVIPPQTAPSQKEIRDGCSGQNTNLTDSMFGFTQ
ncbi:MAG: glycosyltransferase family 39 protein [Candidatus Blackburnbacteria bacterium]|nr:glycosyltransferase family 39 protein [Candidatus Blackburnbacteria bacterium]